MAKETERGLTHVKQSIDLDMLMCVLGEGAFAQVQAVSKMADRVHNAAVEEAAKIAAEFRFGLDGDGELIAEEIRAKLLRAP